MAPAKKKPKKSHLWARDPDDWYVENAWASAALFQRVKFDGVITDPCCGMGRILDAAQDAGYETIGFDIKDRGAGKRHPFLIRDILKDDDIPMVNAVLNPPYKYDDEIVKRVMDRVQRRAAFLFAAQWANGDKRSRWLETLGLRAVYAITPRPSMPPGAVILAGEKPGNGTRDYSWFIMDKGYKGPAEFGWVRRPPRPEKPKSGKGKVDEEK